MAKKRVNFYVDEETYAIVRKKYNTYRASALVNGFFKALASGENKLLDEIQQEAERNLVIGQLSQGVAEVAINSHKKAQKEKELSLAQQDSLIIELKEWKRLFLEGRDRGIKQSELLANRLKEEIQAKYSIDGELFSKLAWGD